MSGVISPTNLSLFSSSPAGGGGSTGGGGANSNNPRTITPNQQHGNSNSSGRGGGPVSVPRWNTGSFIALDDNMDYSMMSPLIAGGSQDHQGPPLMDDGNFTFVVSHLPSHDSFSVPISPSIIEGFAPTVSNRL